MTLESIEKLRYHIEQQWEQWETEHERLLEFCDEIEREIAERYMELPVDADGVPIRIGDILERVDGGPSQQACCIGPYGFNDAPIWCARDFHHVKPRTVEDVLREFAYKVCDLNVADSEIERYADKLREVLRDEL